tara:strand:+ start:294 stop:1181 length:888 start_codon:yes stop_codon:yes gene_type:complete
MEKNTTANSQITKKVFFCEKCDYNCFRSSDFKKHLQSIKHNTTKLQPKILNICSCGKAFSHRGSLYNHKRTCKYLKNEIVQGDMNEDYKELFHKAMKQMQQQQNELIDELKKKDEIMLEIVNKIGNTTNNTTNNNQFNINMFLNETCKNAMNLSDFIERIEISHDDLENNAQLGFVNGITKILMDNLKLLTIQERPIHCTDVKRETLYVKDEDMWDKKHSNEKLENAIQEVSRKSLKSLINWKKTNPDYEDLDSEFSKKTVYMQQNSSGIGQKESFYPKIIHNLAKENTISQLKN